jgi:hypothetical protein
MLLCQQNTTPEPELSMLLKLGGNAPHHAPGAAYRNRETQWAIVFRAHHTDSLRSGQG